MSKVTFQGNPVKLTGNTVSVGENAPIVNVTGADLSSIQIGGKQGKAQILVVLPSLDTGVCAASARKFNESLANIQNAEVIVISMDLPFAMGRFCATEGIKNLKTASDFRNKEFANAYGVLIADGALAGLSARSVFVINPSGVITYKEISSEITNEPNYEAVINAAKEATSTSCCGHCH
ncbi:thiol peroxidase [Campylobacter mucosalis]|uniref:thiol peroxidase Prx-SUH n=1 Tax=Campylobacter mucosalis TaxID=202 RepID=UPI0004D94FB0|nr:thiol peroxidase [Campylobacter mucosalis]KEA45290.1 thiol peroxidase [Campylobacter mucosalis]QKF63695.1 lipid hydroperoxide peroxidase [Campylobacter mucosalis]